jgi:DNA-binding MarR family transcriptional regulator
MRLFDRWSEQQAKAAGMTTAQHQLLLAIRGHQDPRGPTIGEIADYLLLRHHSVVGLVDRVVALGLIARSRDELDGRVIRLALTPKGARRLEELSKLLVEQLKRLGTNFSNISEGLDPVQHPHGLLK